MYKKKCFCVVLFSKKKETVMRSAVVCFSIVFSCCCFVLLQVWYIYMYIYVVFYRSGIYMQLTLLSRSVCLMCS